MVSPDSQGTACPPSGRNSTYRPVQISGTGSTLVDRILHHVRWHDIYLSIGYALAQIDDAAEVAGFPHVKKGKPRLLSTPYDTVGVRTLHARKRILGAVDNRNIKSRVTSVSHEGLKSAME